VDGTIYFSTPLNIVVAIDAATGEERWRFDPGAWQEEDFLFGFHRGVSYWRSEDGEERILYGTFRDFFYSIDARTGTLDPAFGENGRIDLTQGLGRDVDRFSYSFLSPPIISHDIAVVGSTIIDWRAGRPLPELPPPGDVRGIDVRTGEGLWSFHTVPRDGEFGADTWPEGAWREYGAANVWSMMSADHELGYVYLPTGTISSD
jgi:quinoprotein glucose dehydrogenase